MKRGEATPGPDQVRDFWFGPGRPPHPGRRQQRRWFSGGQAMDRDVRQHFGSVVEAALTGGLEDWEQAPGTALALVLVLDQFPRHCFRGQARAFAGDARARGLVEQWLEDDGDRELAPVERSFFYLPLEHSEDEAALDRCVELYRALSSEGRDATEEKLLRSSLEYAEAHREIIRRFGRYPHRNRALGRDDTPEERDWLKAGGKRYGQ